MPSPRIKIITPDTPAQFEATRLIFREYAQQLDVDLCFQNFEAELADLPGDYSQPHGALLLALVGGELAGCCGMRPLMSSNYPNACEMKRLWVEPEAQGLGLGAQLARAAIAFASAAGFVEMKLDTLRERSLRYIFPDISTQAHLEHTVRLVASGRVRLQPTITHVLTGLESVPQAFEITANKGKYQAINPAQVVIKPLTEKAI